MSPIAPQDRSTDQVPPVGHSRNGRVARLVILLLGLAAGIAPWGAAALARVGEYLTGTTAMLADSIPANDIVFGPRRFDALPSGGALYVEQFSVDLRAGEFYQLKIHNPYVIEGARVDSFVLELNGSVIVTSADMGASPYWIVPVALQASNTLRLSMPADSGAMSV